jgi:transposase
LRLSEWLAVNGCTHVAMEATGIYWKPVWHILDDSEFELVLANAAHVKNVPGRKTDVNDAMWLAELLAHGLIRASFVPNAQTQEMRNLLRTRNQLVREQWPGYDRGPDCRSNQSPPNWPTLPIGGSRRHLRNCVRPFVAG